jgi:lactobin A/cerein 7B family class IIb bacteriocin
MHKMNDDELQQVGGGIVPVLGVAIIAAIGMVSFSFALGLTWPGCARRKVYVATR